MPILLLTIVLSGMGFGLVLPAFLFYAGNLGASPLIATTIVALYSFGQFFVNPIWGRMSDRYGRKPILLVSASGMVAAYLLMAFAENLWVLGFARMLTGIMGANVSVAMAYVADVTPVEKRAQGMGWVGGAISFGFIIGPAFGGLLGGADADSATLMWPALGAAAVSCFTLCGTFFIKESLPPEKRAQASAADDRPKGLAAVRMVLRRPTVTRLIIIGFLIYFAMGFFETIMPLWSEARFGWGPRDIGLCFTYLGFVVAITQGYFVGKLAPRFGESKLVLFGVASYCFGLLWMTQASIWQTMVFGITFTAGGAGLAVASMTSLVSRQAGEHERGLVLGVYNSSAWMGRFMGPPVSGLLFQSVAVQAPLYGAAIIMFVCFWAVRALRSHLKRTTGEIPTA
jgi:multidrug resistance protein